MASVLSTTDGFGNTQIYLVGGNVATVTSTGNDMTQGTTFNPNTFNFANNIIYTEDYTLSSNLTIPFPTSSLVFGTQVLFTLIVPSNNTYTLSFVGAYGDIVGFNNGTTLNAGRYIISLVNEGTTKGFVNVAQSISSGSGGTTLSIVSAIAASNGLSIAVLFNQAISGTAPYFTVTNATINGTQTISGNTVTIPISPAISQNANVSITGGTNISNGTTNFAGITGYTVNTSGIGVAVQPATNLVLTNKTNTIVSLGWTASVTSGATYTVFDNGVLVSSNISIVGTTAIISGLAQGSSHSYTVVASFGGNNSVPTSALAVTLLNNLAALSLPAVTSALSNANAPISGFLTNTSKLNVTKLDNTGDEDITISFDIKKVSNTQTYNNIFTINNSTTSESGINIRLDTFTNSFILAYISFGQFGNGVSQYSSATDYNLSSIAFTNITIVFKMSGTRTITTYRNGIAFDSDTNGGGATGNIGNMGLFNGSQKLVIGGSFNTNTNNEGSKDLHLDNVLMFKQALTPTQVTELYNGGVTKFPPTLSFYSSCVLDLKFNNNLTDESPNPITLTGTPTYV